MNSCNLHVFLSSLHHFKCQKVKWNLRNNYRRLGIWKWRGGRETEFCAICAPRLIVSVTRKDTHVQGHFCRNCEKALVNEKIRKKAKIVKKKFRSVWRAPALWRSPTTIFLTPLVFFSRSHARVLGHGAEWVHNSKRPYFSINSFYFLFSLFVLIALKVVLCAPIPQ